MTKSFGAAKADRAEAPIPFVVGDEEFLIPRPLDGVVMLDLAEMSDTENSGVDATKAFAAFFRSLLNEDYARFKRACSRAHLPLGSQNEDDSLLGIVKYVLEEGTGRPTEQPSDSVAPLSSVGTTSPVAATSEVSAIQ